MTFGVVGASLILQGLTMGPLLGRLGLAGGDERGMPPEEYGEMEDPATRVGPGEPDTATRDLRRG